VYENKGTHKIVSGEKRGLLHKAAAICAKSRGLCRCSGGFTPPLGEVNSPLRRTSGALAGPEEQGRPGMSLFVGDGPEAEKLGKKYAGASGDVYENKGTKN
jgi:hypothetical protein